MKLERWQAALLNRMVEWDHKAGRWTAKPVVLRLPRRRFWPDSVSDSLSTAPDEAPDRAQDE